MKNNKLEILKTKLHSLLESKYSTEIKFILVGIVNTIIGALTMFICYEITKMYMFSSAMNIVVGSIVSYFLNKYFTFKNNEKSLKQIILFILNTTLCYILAYKIAKNLMVSILGNSPIEIVDRISLLTGMVLYTILNYFGQKFIVFKDTKEDINSKNKFFKKEFFEIKNLEKLFKGFISGIFVIIGVVTIIQTLVIYITFHVHPETETLTPMAEKGYIVLSIICGLYLFNYLGYILYSKFKQLNDNKKKIINRIIIGVIGLIVVGFFGFWFKNSYTQSLADQGKVLYDAVDLVNNKKTFGNVNHYYMKAPQQIPLLYFEYIILKGSSTIFEINYASANKVMQIFNIVCILITLIFIYKIFKNGIKENNDFDNNNKEKIEFLNIPFLLISINFAILSLFIFIYGDIPGILFTTISLYYFTEGIKTNKLKNIIISTIFLSLAVTVRANFFIFFIAQIIILILETIKKINFEIKSEMKKEEKLKKIFITVVLLIFTTSTPLLTSKIVKDTFKNNWYKEQNWQQEDIYPVSTMSFLAMGMSKSGMGPGWFSSIVKPAWEENTNVDYIFKDAIKERIKEFVKNPMEFVKFYGLKTASVWTDTSYQAYFHNRQFIIEEKEFEKIVYEYDKKRDEHPVLKHFESYNFEKMFNTYTKVIFVIIMYNSVIYISRKLKRKEDFTVIETILILSIIGGYAFSILWEAKSRYILPFIYSLYPLGFIAILNNWEYKLDREVKNNKKI